MYFSGLHEGASSPSVPHGTSGDPCPPAPPIFSPLVACFVFFFFSLDLIPGNGAGESARSAGLTRSSQTGPARPWKFRLALCAAFTCATMHGLLTTSVCTANSRLCMRREKKKIENTHAVAVSTFSPGLSGQTNDDAVCALLFRTVGCACHSKIRPALKCNFWLH